MGNIRGQPPAEGNTGLWGIDLGHRQGGERRHARGGG